MFNDIALLKFEGKVALDDKVGTICLPQQDDKVPSGSMCYMTGSIHEQYIKISSRYEDITYITYIYTIQVITLTK